MNNFTKVAIGIGEFLDLLWKTLKSIKSFSTNIIFLLFSEIMNLLIQLNHSLQMLISFFSKYLIWEIERYL